MQVSPAIESGVFLTKGMSLGHSSFNMKWIRELGIRPTVIFDIGGYDAGDAVRFSEYYKKCKVYCFESDPCRHEIISEYIHKYHVNLYDYCVGDKNGDVGFYQATCMGKDAGDTHTPGQYAGQGSRFKHTDKYKKNYDHIIQAENAIKVQGITIDKFCEQNRIPHIDIAHIDVEGGEYDVVCGFGAMRPKIVFVETLSDDFWQSPHTEEMLHSKLINNGYELVLDLISDKLYFHNE